MENQEHPDFNEDAAFDEAVESLQSGESPADNPPSDAETIPQDVADHNENSTPNSEPELPDWLANATDEVKENFRRLEADNQRYQHQARSQNGRVGALTKKYQQAQAEIERLKQQQNSPINGMESLEENYPEIAAVVREMLERQEQQLAEYSKPLKRLAETQIQELAQQQLDNSVDYVRNVIPDALEIINSAQFTSWLSRQPTGIQALYSSNNVDDAIYLLSEYKKVVSATTEKRTKQNQQFAAMTLPNGRTAPKGGEEVDEDMLFDRIANEMKKQRYPF